MVLRGTVGADEPSSVETTGKIRHFERVRGRQGGAVLGG